jgi:predicted DNA-binding transcriptional regulator YafY
MRADRLLSILLLLQLHGRMTARQLAKRLEVAERTIHRDMGALGTAGVPVVADRGVGGGWSLLEGYRTSLTALNETEIQSLFVSGPPQLLADLGLRKASETASLKVTSLLPAVLRRNAELARQRIHIDMSGWNRSRDPVPMLPLLQDAVWRDARIEMTYDRGPECEPAKRVLDPLGLVAKGSAWYLVAAIDDGVRTYRVSRIRSVKALEQTFVRPAQFDLASYWDTSAAQFAEKMPRYEVVLNARTSSIHWVYAMVRFGAIDKVEPQSDGWSRVNAHFDAEEVALHFVLGMAGAVKVIEPAALARKVVEAAAEVT